MAKFDEKFALITGGSEGIGKECAKELFKQGASVAILSRSAEKLEIARKEIELLRTKSEQKLETFTLDVTQFEDCQKVLAKILDSMGTPDYVINCAGYARPGYIDQLEMDHFRQMMDLNYFGIVHICKILAPVLANAKKGHIINTSSIAGFIGLFGYTGYCASKYAVVGFSEALRRELEPSKVKVSVLCPPNTRTPGLTEENKFKPKEVLAAEEKAKSVNPEEVAKALIKKLDRFDFMIVPTIDGGLAYLLSRFAPSLLHQFVKRKA